jgi:biopolymer transport protein ExbB
MNRLLSRAYLPSRFLVLAAAAIVVLACFPELASAQDGGGEAPAPAPAKNKLVHLVESLGWIFGPVLLSVSVALVALVVLLALDLRMSAAIPAGFVDEFTDTVNKRKFKEAFDMARSDPSFLGRVLTAGMGRLQYGIEDAREAAMNTLEAIKSDKDQKNNYTAVIASLGPMLGLVGTVYGMIGAFMVLGESTSTPNASALASNISHALSVTLVGIAISVPAIFFNAFFRNRITKVTMDVGHIADDLLTQMYHNSKKPAAAPGLPVPGPTPPPPAPTGRPTAAVAPSAAPAAPPR